MNIAILETESTLTDRYQTTVPESVRQALKLSKRDKVHYSILDNGDVLLSRGQKIEPDDPALDQFLSFLSIAIPISLLEIFSCCRPAMSYCHIRGRR